MSEVFYKVLEMSLYGSIAILAVLLFRLVFTKCPKRVLILFWIIVGLRLIIPFNFNSPTSALNIGKFFAPKTASQETTAYDPEARLREMTAVDTVSITETNSEQAPAFGSVDEAVSYIQENEQKAAENTAKTIIAYIWFIVMAGLLVFSVIRYAVFYSKARWSSRSFDGRYYMANDIDSPFVVGIIKPKIFFPINMDDDEREYVLNHEWTHIKNKDGLTKLISYIILCIHWFNPFVWLAFFMLCADIEMRVDEETTSNFSLSMVKEYCLSLVRHAADDNKGAFMQSTAFSGLSFGGMETKMRIKNLLDKKINSKAVQIAAIAVTMVFAVLVSAASVDHRHPVKVKPAETVPSESGAISDPTEESDPGAILPTDETDEKGGSESVSDTSGPETSESDTSETTESGETSETTEVTPSITVTVTPTSSPTPPPVNTPTNTPVPTEPVATQKRGSVNNLKDGSAAPLNWSNDACTLEGNYGAIVITRNQDAKKINITYNDQLYTLSINNDSSKVVFAGASFLVKSGGKAYIYLTTLLNAGTYDVNVYEISDSNVQYKGHKKGVMLPGTISDTRSFKCGIDGGDNDMYITRNYRIAPATGLPVNDGYMCSIKVYKQHKASKDITGYVVKNGKATSEQMTIKEGEICTPVELNDVEYIDIKDADGNIIRADFVPLLEEYYDVVDETWVYKAVRSLVKPA